MEKVKRIKIVKSVKKTRDLRYKGRLFHVVQIDKNNTFSISDAIGLPASAVRMPDEAFGEYFYYETSRACMFYCVSLCGAFEMYKRLVKIMRIDAIKDRTYSALPFVRDAVSDFLQEMLPGGFEEK